MLLTIVLSLLLTAIYAGALTWDTFAQVAYWNRVQEYELSLVWNSLPTGRQLVDGVPEFLDEEVTSRREVA